MGDIVFADCETFSRADLKKVGTYAYCEHESTEPILWSLLGMEWPRSVVYRVPDLFEIFWELRQTNQLRWKLRDVSDPLYVVHWGVFDRLIALHTESERLEERGETLAFLDADDGTPALLGPMNTRWCDLRHLSLTYGGPAKLEEAAKWWGRTDLKSPGANLINRFCKPQKDGRRVYPSDDFTRWGAFEAYAAQDTQVLRPIWQRFTTYARSGAHGPRQHWRGLRAVERMNERGVPMDLESVSNAQHDLELAEQDLAERCEEKYGFRPTQVEKVRQFLDLPDCRADTIDEAWDDLNEQQQEVATMRRAVSGAARKKLVPMERMASEDGRVRGCFDYHGAHTRRLTSFGVQFQNMVRSPSDDGFFEALNQGADFEDLFGAVRQNIRGFIKAPEGRTLVAADYSQIELRVGAWLAGETWLLDALEAWDDAKRRGDRLREYANDPYRISAAETYGRRPEDIDGGFERQVGKTKELQCLFQASGAGLHGYCERAGLDVTKDETAEMVKSYRASHPAIVRAWRELDEAFRGLVGAPPKAKDAVGVLELERLDHCIRVVRPSGFASYYWLPALVEGQWPDGQPKMDIEYTGRDRAGKMSRMNTYGGDIFQTCVQGTAADLMLEGLERADAAGFEPILSIHDEIVCEIDPKRYSTPPTWDPAENLCENLCGLPDWAEGLPVTAEGWISDRFTK